MTDEKRNWVRTVIMSVTIGFLGGVGVMAMTLHGDVREHNVLISQHSRDLEDEKKRTDSRIFQLADMFKEANALVKASIEHTSKLVTTIEAQNKLIVEQNQLINKLRTLRP